MGLGLLIPGTARTQPLLSSPFTLVLGEGVPTMGWDQLWKGWGLMAALHQVRAIKEGLMGCTVQTI